MYVYMRPCQKDGSRTGRLLHTNGWPFEISWISDLLLTFKTQFGTHPIILVLMFQSLYTNQLSMIILHLRWRRVKENRSLIKGNRCSGSYTIHISFFPWNNVQKPICCLVKHNTFNLSWYTRSFYFLWLKFQNVSKQLQSFINKLL